MNFKYLLDTNICIYIMKEKPPSVKERFEQLEAGLVAMSLITHAELLYGAQKSNNSKKAERILLELKEYIPVLPMSLKVPHFYATLRANLEKQGRIIGNNDLWIAAHCVELNLTLITNNEKEFSRVDSLKTENWLAN